MIIHHTVMFLGNTHLCAGLKECLDLLGRCSFEDCSVFQITCFTEAEDCGIAAHQYNCQLSVFTRTRAFHQFQTVVFISFVMRIQIIDDQKQTAFRISSLLDQSVQICASLFIC